MSLVYKTGLKPVEIDLIESEIKRTFPDDYRAFLISANGCFVAAPEFAQIQLSAVDEGTISFDQLFGLLPGEDCNDLISFNKEFVDELDFVEEAVVIGEDGGGNPYVIIGKAGSQGVYYWDRTHLHESDSKNQFDIPEQNGSGNLFFISGTFREFLDLVIMSVGGAATISRD